MNTEKLRHIISQTDLSDQDKIEQIKELLEEQELAELLSKHKFKYQDKTEKELINKVIDNGYNLKDIPPAQRTEKVCMAAIEQCGDAIKYVPEAIRTPEIYLVAAQRNGYAIQYIPRSMRTAKICLAAIKNAPDARKYLF